MSRAAMGVLIGVFCATLVPPAKAQQAKAPTSIRPAENPLQIVPKDVLTGAIDNRVLEALPASVHPKARRENDAGRVPPGLALPGMTLVLRRSPAQQSALDSLVAEQQNPRSPLYHRWLTPDEFGAHFGLSKNDLNKLAAWLKQGGFTVDEIPKGRWTIIFSGTAAQVESVFHTEIHYYDVEGARHRANATPLEIPKALAPVVVGILGIHDFRPVPAAHQGFVPHFGGNESYYLLPSDYATIYDINPLYSGGTDGSGQTIAIVGRCSIDPTVVGDFRSLTGLPAKNPTVTVVGQAPAPCSGADFGEPYLDVEWSGAVARNANIVLVVATDIGTAASYIVNNNLAPVVSTSFYGCEAGAQAAGNQFWLNLWEQAASHGITSLVSSGDSGAAGCDKADTGVAVNGLGVNALCSTPYDICVGGTEFDDSSNPGQFWSAQGNALGYIPEEAWNESGNVTGGSGLWSSGGGYSIVYPKTEAPWQTGNTSSWRGVPDVSLTAAGHDGYIVCENVGCNPFYVFSGTSAAAPSFAGLLALVVQRTGSRQGAANAALYALASQNGVFHDIVLGNNSVPGQAGYSAGTGWDPVTGLGSVDANLMVTNWGSTSTSAPSVLLSSSNVTFGDQAVGTTSSSQIVTVTNNGNAVLNISSIGLQGANTGDFPSKTTCQNPGTLGAGQNCLLSISFQPSAAGARTASISISDNAAGSPQTVSLSGNGTSGAAAPPTVVADLTSNASGIVNGNCSTPPQVTSFAENASAVWLYFDLNGVNMGDTLRMSFIRPDGVVYTNLTATSGYSGSVCFSYYVDISGNPASSYPGTWTIQTFWDQLATPLFSLHFTISAVAHLTSVLPQFGVGSGFVTDFYAVNSSNGTASFSMSFRDDGGNLVSLPFAGIGSLSTLTGSIPAGGAAFYEAGTPSGPGQFGSALVTSDPGITIQALFRRQGSDGSYYEAAVPTAAGSNEIQVPFDATTFGGNGSQIYTGLAIANLDPSNAASVSCTARDSTGNAILNAISVPMLNPLGHWSGYQFPALTGKRGTFDCTSNTLIGAIGTRALGFNALSSLPVITLPAVNSGGTSVLPQFGVGAGFVTDFYAVNSSNGTASFSMSFRDDGGNPVSLPFAGIGSLSTLSGSIPAGGAAYYEAGTPNGPGQFGSALVTSDPGITIQALFRRQGSDGSYYEAAVPTAAGSNEIQVPFDATTFGGNGSQIYTGLAIANLDPSNAASVSCTARDSTGNTIPNAISVPILNPLGHWSGYQFPALAGKRGTFDCTSNTLIGAIGTRALGFNALSSLPVITH